MGLPVPKARNSSKRLDPAVREAIVAARLGGMTYTKIAKVFSLAASTVHFICKRAGA